MWMRVVFRRSSVRGPSRVPDSVRSIERPQADRFFKIAMLALRASYRERSIVVDHCDSRRIISAILELLESVQNHPDDLLVPDISNYSAHLSSSSVFALYGRPSVAAPQADQKLNTITLGRPRRAAPTRSLQLLLYNRRNSCDQRIGGHIFCYH